VNAKGLTPAVSRNVPDDMKLARAALPLVGKIASNRNQVVYRYPPMRVYFERTKGSELWIGRAPPALDARKA
jgi:hypothetical protein